MRRTQKKEKFNTVKHGLNDFILKSSSSFVHMKSWSPEKISDMKGQSAIQINLPWQKVI